MAAAGYLQCGSTQVGVSEAVMNDRLTVSNIDLVALGGTCNLALSVSDTASPNPYGLPWQSPLTGFAIGTQPAYAFTDQISPLCQRQFCPPGEQQVQVLFSGPGPEPTAGGAWTITSSGGVGDCASSLILTTPGSFPVTIQLPSTCHHASDVNLTITYEYLGQTVTVPLGPPAGTPATTTTSTSSTSTTTTTTTTTSTTPPGSSTSSPGTSSPGTTSPSTAAAASATPSGPPPELAAARAPLLAGDPDIRTALEWGLPLAGAMAAWCVGVAWRTRRRPQRRRTRS
jgi:hypothetical protein